MREAFLSMYKDKHLTVLQVISSLKDKKIKYEATYRIKDIRGCFINVKFKASTTTDIFNDDDDNNLDYIPNEGIIKTKDEEINRLKEQIRKLEAEAKDPLSLLKIQINNMPRFTIKKEIKAEVEVAKDNKFTLFGSDGDDFFNSF